MTFLQSTKACQSRRALGSFLAWFWKLLTCRAASLCCHSEAAGSLRETGQAPVRSNACVRFKSSCGAVNNSSTSLLQAMLELTCSVIASICSTTSTQK